MLYLAETSFWDMHIIWQSSSIQRNGLGCRGKHLKTTLGGIYVYEISAKNVKSLTEQIFQVFSFSKKIIQSQVLLKASKISAALISVEMCKEGEVLAQVTVFTGG